MRPIRLGQAQKIAQLAEPAPAFFEQLDQGREAAVTFQSGHEVAQVPQGPILWLRAWSRHPGLGLLESQTRAANQLQIRQRKGKGSLCALMAFENPPDQG